MRARFSLNSIKSSHWLWMTLCLSLGLSFATYFNDNEASEQLLVLPKAKQIKSINLDALANTTPLNHASNLVDDDKYERALDLSTQHNLFRVLDLNTTVQTHQVQKSKMAKVQLKQEFTPTAPPIPFIYMGKLENTPKGTVVYLQGNNKVYTVAKGEKIDPFWRLDDEFIISLQLTYLPLNLQQVLLKTQKPDVSLPVDNLN